MIDKHRRIDRLIVRLGLVCGLTRGHVHPGHFHPVDPRDETVIHERPELQCIHFGRVGHDERPAQEDAAIIVLHVRELRAAGTHIAIPERRGGTAERRVRKTGRAPEGNRGRRLGGALEQTPEGIGLDEVRAQ